jgi:aminopeptidase N
LSYPRAKPTHYNLAIHDIEFGGKFGYQGTVRITLNLNGAEGSNEIVLNTNQLKIQSAELKTDGTKQTKSISYDDKRQRATLDFGEKIQHSGEATLTIKFEGSINNVRQE